MRLFKNRVEAAEELARHLDYLRADHPVVIGLYGGGVILAEVVARLLDCPLDIMLIEKLTAPGAPDQVVGAVDEHGRISMIESSARWHHVTSQELVAPGREAFGNLQRIQGRVRRVLSEFDVRGRSVVLIDEGVTTGARMLGAIASVRDRGAKQVIVAAPAGTSESTWALHDAADSVVIPHRPSKFKGIDRFYEEYSSVDDDEILRLIQRWVAARPEQQPGVNTVLMKVQNSLDLRLSCEIDMPPGATRGSGPYPAVIFAHGFDSDSRSPRNVLISRRLAKRGIMGVRMNFTGHGASEGRHHQATPEQALLDLDAVFKAVHHTREVNHHEIGIIGSGEGGLVALHYAARVPQVAALVLRGPICQNERRAAAKVSSPTLIIHAEGDTALENGVRLLDGTITGAHEVLRIPRANRLFNDPVSRELMVNASVQWMADHLRDPTTTPQYKDVEIRTNNAASSPTRHG